MNKKLIIILALAFVVGISVAAFAEVQNVKVGGDITAVALDRKALTFVNGYNTVPTTANNEFATISRIKIDANLTDNVDVTFRLLNERVWGGATGNTGTDVSPSEIDIDLAYITLKDFMKDTTGVPLTFLVGRQNIKIGSGLLIGWAGTNQSNTTQLPVGAGDLSARAAFDAIVGVWDFTPELSVTTGFVKVTESAVTDGSDTDAYVVNASYKLGENAMNTVLEGTYALSRIRRANINNYGGRVTSIPIKDLNIEGEYVYQLSNTLSRTNDVADAVRLGANYVMPEVTWKPGLAIDYMRLSNHWNAMHESLVPADLANLIFDNTNLSVVGVTVSAKPKDDLLLKLRYANLNLTKKIADNGTTYNSSALGVYTTEANKKALGYEVDAGVAYDYTSDVQFGLNYGLLKPGKVFVAKKPASQVLGSMRVSF